MITQYELNRYIKERNKAIATLNVDKVKKFCIKWGIMLPDNNKVIMAGICKSALQITTMSQEVKEEAGKWLDENNFKRTIE